MNTLDRVIAETLHGTGKIEMISRKTGLTKSALYRYGLPPATSGLDIPLRKVASIVRAAGDYRILHALAAECGFLCFQPPRVGCSGAQSAADFQRSAAEAVVRCLEYFEKPTLTLARAATASLDMALRTAAALKRALLRRGQNELAL
jgi:hypothetical protein